MGDERLAVCIGKKLTHCHDIVSIYFFFSTEDCMSIKLRKLLALIMRIFFRLNKNSMRVVEQRDAIVFQVGVRGSIFSAGAQYA